MSCWHNAGVGSLDGRTASFSIAVRTSRAENENCTSPYETQRPRAEFSWDGCLEAKRGAAGAHTAARRGAARRHAGWGRPWGASGRCGRATAHHSSRRTLSRVSRLATRDSQESQPVVEPSYRTNQNPVWTGQCWSSAYTCHKFTNSVSGRR